MSTNLSPNMNLPIPVTNEDPGPDYANNVNASLLTIDSHNHSSGQGVPITPNGMSINADLPFGGNNATQLRSVRFTTQGSPLAGGSDLGCLYESGVDLYYNDGLGNQVRITQSGGVAGSPGSIGSLTSPASVTYVSATPAYVFQSDASTSADIDAGSYVFRNNNASSNGITVSAPSALAANYALIWPVGLPGSTSFVTLSSAGAIAAGPAISQGITRSYLAPVGQNISNSSGNFSTTSSSFVDVSNLLLAGVVTTGRPVRVFLMADENGGAVNTNGGGFIQILRDSTVLCLQEYGTGTFPAGMDFLDVVSGGTYTYKVQARKTGTAIFVSSYKLVVYEL